MRRKMIIGLLISVAICLVAAFATGCGSPSAITGTPGLSGILDVSDEHTHTYETYVYNNDATCTEDGTETATCTITGCDETDTRASADHLATGHSWSEWEIEETRHHHACENSGCTATEEDEHDTLEVIAEVPATCTTGGKSAGRACSICHRTMEEQEDTEPDPENHVWGSWTDNGAKHQHACTECSESQEADHDSAEILAAVAATCTKAGLTEGSNCSVCHKTMTAQNVTEIDPANHSYTNYISNNDATCTDDGTKTATCDHGCSATDDQPDPGSALGHAWAQTLSNDETNHWHACTRAGCDVTTEAEVHDYNTDDDDATNDYDCTVCGYYNASVGLVYTGYKLVDGTPTKTETDIEYYAVSGIGTATGCIRIPLTYNGVAVTAIDKDAFRVKAAVTGVFMKDNITSIGSEAFYSCSNLVNIVFSNELISIGYGAFRYCQNLVGNVIIPNSVTSIGRAAFNLCSGIKSITIGNSIETIGDGAFQKCSSLVEVIIPDSVKTIDKYAFQQCTSLAEVVIPDSVETIGEGAFDTCEALTSITIGNGVKTIGMYAFNYCKSVSTLTMGSAIESCGGQAFAGLKNLSRVNYNGTLESWCKISFSNGEATPLSLNNNTRIVNLYIQGKLLEGDLTLNCTTIGDYAFNRYPNITSVTIGDSVTTIGRLAFGSSKITSVKLGSKLTEIGSSAFGYCQNLESISVAESNTVYRSSGNCLISTAENTIIAGCKNSIIPDDGTVKGIGAYVFSNCTELTSITIPSSVEIIDRGAFSGAGLISLTIGSGVTKIYEYAFNGCDTIETVNYLGTLATWCAIVFNGSEANPLRYAKNLFFVDGETSTNLLTDGKLKISEDVNKIGKYAFANFEAITSVEISSPVTEIGNYAFESCTGIISVTISDSVIRIGVAAFRWCSNLTSVTFENTNNWFWSESETATSGKAINVEDAAVNATRFKNSTSYYNRALTTTE